MASKKESSAGSDAPVTSLPADNSFKTSIDHNNPGRVMLRSKASQRAMEAQIQLAKLTKAGMSDLSDEKLSQMSMALGLQVRGTGASGNVTRGDYMTALEARLPIPVTKTGRA